MKILITDDEPLARERLRRLVGGLGEPASVVAEAQTGAEAVLLCERLQPHLILLDIAMPGMDGLEVARHLAQSTQPPAVIFTTAYDRFALEAFEANAVSYLLKPIRSGQLQQAIARARTPSRAQLATLQAKARPRSVRTQLCARRHGELELLPLSAVTFLHADQKYVTAHHSAGELLLDESLKSLEAEFAARFIRIHRHTLVARGRIEGLVRDRLGHTRLRLRGVSELLEVSRRHVAGLRRLLSRPS